MSKERKNMGGHQLQSRWSLRLCSLRAGRRIESRPDQWRKRRGVFLAPAAAPSGTLARKRSAGSHEAQSGSSSLALDGILFFPPLLAPIVQPLNRDFSCHFLFLSHLWDVFHDSLVDVRELAGGDVLHLLVES